MLEGQRTHLQCLRHSATPKPSDLPLNHPLSDKPHQTLLASSLASPDPPHHLQWVPFPVWGQGEVWEVGTT